jgi:hypothetical protein
MTWVLAWRFSRSGDFGIHVKEELGARALLAFASTQQASLILPPA